MKWNSGILSVYKSLKFDHICELYGAVIYLYITDKIFIGWSYIEDYHEEMDNVVVFILLA